MTEQKEKKESGWPLLVFPFSIIFCFLIEFFAVVIAEKIQSGSIRKASYWLIIIMSRICMFVTIYSVANTPETDSKTDMVNLAALLAWPYGGICLLLVLSILAWIIVYLSIALPQLWEQKIFIRNRKYWPIWIRQSKIRNRHIHLPIRDIFQLFALMAFRVAEFPDSLDVWGLGHFIVPYRRQIYPLITLDFDIIDDPLWPDRSLLHTIMVFSCCSCSKDDGIYLVTTSLLQHKTWTTFIGRSNIIDSSPIANLRVYAVQTGGFIFVKILKGMKTELFIHDMRQGRTRIIDVSSAFDEDANPIWFLPDDGHDWGDDHDESSIYVRAIYVDRIKQQLVPFCFGHCLLRISGVEQVEKKIMEEIDYPLPWDNCKQNFFRTSTCLGLFVKIDYANAANAGIRNIRKPFTIFDLKSRRMTAMRDIKALLEGDRPIRLIAQRYYKCDDMASMQDLFMRQEEGITSNISLNDREGMLVDRKWRIWTTRFQPATLKFICLREIFQRYKCRYTARDWNRVARINLGKHFP